MQDTRILGQTFVCFCLQLVYHQFQRYDGSGFFLPLLGIEGMEDASYNLFQQILKEEAVARLNELGKVKPFISDEYLHIYIYI